MASDQGSEDAYVRARRDPDFRDAVRRSYVGRLAVLNALWWMSHPADAAPDGTPSPLDDLRDLQRRVFSASGGSLGDPDATRALRGLEAELAAERIAIREAVEAAADAEKTGPGLESLFPADPVEAAEAGGDAGLEGEPPSPGNTRSSARNGHLVIGAALVAALACGILIGSQWNGGRVDASPSVAPSATPAPGAAAFARAEAACAQMSDVATILLNGGSAFAGKRWTEQEWQGALALAARVLERVDTDDGTALSSRIDTLKVLFPGVSGSTAPGQALEMTPEMNVAYQNVSDACGAAGSPIAVSGWTGG